MSNTIIKIISVKILGKAVTGPFLKIGYEITLSNSARLFFIFLSFLRILKKVNVGLFALISFNAHYIYK